MISLDSIHCNINTAAFFPLNFSLPLENTLLGLTLFRGKSSVFFAATLQDQNRTQYALGFRTIAIITPTPVAFFQGDMRKDLYKSHSSRSIALEAKGLGIIQACQQDKGQPLLPFPPPAPKTRLWLSHLPWRLTLNSLGQ